MDEGREIAQQHDWLGFLNYLWTGMPPSAHGAVVLGAGFLIVLLVLIILTSGNSQSLSANGKELPPISTRGSKPKGPVYIPLVLGNVTIDLQPTSTDTIHTVLAGTSGLGKSTTVLPLFDLPVGVLCVALDNTRPIAAKVRAIGGEEWTNEPDWGVGLNLLAGKPTVASEVLVEGWSAKTAGDTGKWRDIAEGRLHKALVAMDNAGLPRDVGDLATALALKTGNTEADRACQDWAGRLERLSERLGPALGSDLDLVQAMRDRKKVLLRLNRFSNPRLAPMLGGMLLVHARRVAEEAGVPFVLIVEEAGQLGQYEQQMSALAQAGRDRGVPLILLTQNASLLPLEVQNNVSVWVSFAQEADRELRFASERLRLDKEQLLREAFKDNARGWCYVRAPGLPTTIVRVKQQKPVPTKRGAPSIEFDRTSVVGSRTPRRRTIVAELWQPLESAVASLPMPALEVQEVLAKIDRTQGECWLWTGSIDRDGYGLQRWTYADGRPKNNRPAHQVVWEIVNGRGFPIGPTGRMMEWDHNRSCPRHCVNPGHGSPRTKRDNVQNMHRTRGHKTSVAVD